MNTLVRIINLIVFELKKILNNKKAFLFLLVLNITPIIASLVLLLVYITCKGFGFGEVQFSGMKIIVQQMFKGHFFLFGYIAPFFLALIVGDSFSTEFGRGYMKMLLLTPVKRWQVITAKTSAIITYLLIAVLLGGIILQTDLLIARSVTQTSGVLSNALQKNPLDESLSMVSFSSASQLLIITFIANIMLIGFFIILSMFFESAILMTFSSMGIVMGIHIFYLSSSIIKTLFNDISNLKTLVNSLNFISQNFCFTRHFTEVFSMEIIGGVLDGKQSIWAATNTPNPLLNSLGWCLLWSIIFYGIATWIFSRKQVLH